MNLVWLLHMVTFRLKATFWANILCSTHNKISVINVFLERGWKRETERKEEGERWRNREMEGEFDRFNTETHRVLMWWLQLWESLELIVSPESNKLIICLMALPKLLI